VFIGISPDRADIEKRLTACLLTDSEINTKILGSSEVNPIKPLPAAAWKESEAAEVAIKKKWMRIAVMLAVFTIVWNLAEGVVSVRFGLEAESLSVISFGVDSMIEVISACFVLWRLWSIQPGESAAPKQIRRERIATFGIAVLLIGLAISAVAGAIWSLIEHERPDDTTAGIVISSISLSFMFGLWWAKMNAAIILDSRTLEADAACSFGCITLSVVLFLGSVLFHATEKLWFADAVAAMIIALVIGWDGIGEMRASLRKDFDGCGCSHKPGRAAKFLRKKLLTSQGNLKSAFNKSSLPTLDPTFTQSNGMQYCQVHSKVEESPCKSVVIDIEDKNLLICKSQCCTTSDSQENVEVKVNAG